MEGKTDKAFIDAIRNHGLQVTYQRLAIYQALYFSNEKHPSAEVIYREVKKHLPMISLATVYKTLDKFCEAGLIQKVDPAAEAAPRDAVTGPRQYMICGEVVQP